MGLSEIFGGEGCADNSEWELGDVMIVSVSGSPLILSGRELGEELIMGSERFEC